MRTDLCQCCANRQKHIYMDGCQQCNTRWIARLPTRLAREHLQRLPELREQARASTEQTCGNCAKVNAIRTDGGRCEARALNTTRSTTTKKRTRRFAVVNNAWAKRNDRNNKQNIAIHLWAMYERFGAPDEPTTATDRQQVCKANRTRKPVSRRGDLEGSGPRASRRRHQGRDALVEGVYQTQGARRSAVSDALVFPGNEATT